MNFIIAECLIWQQLQHELTNFQKFYASDPTSIIVSMVSKWKKYFHLEITISTQRMQGANQTNVIESLHDRATMAVHENGMKLPDMND